MPLSSPSCAVGLDVGGTKIAGGLVDLGKGCVHERIVIPSEPARGADAVLADLRLVIDRLLAHAAERHWHPRAIGLALAELVGSDGRILSAATFPWENLPLPERLGLSLPLRLEADVRALALAEARLGVGRGLQNFLAIAAGTGISCCLVVDGRPFHGARGLTGTLASHAGCFPSTAGELTTALALEEYASGPALAARMHAARPSFRGSGREVAELARTGDPQAIDIVRTAGHALGAAIAHLINVLDPEAVVLGGGLGLSGGLFEEALVRSVRAHTWSPLLRTVPVLHAATGSDAALIGAALGVGNR